MGFVEVLKKLPTVLTNIKFCKNDILQEKPDKIILIDFPGFNMRIAKWAKKQGFEVFYYIAPQAWAWKKNRVFKIKKTVDKLFCILPFEKDFFSKYGIKTFYFGHPLIQELLGNDENSEKVAENNNIALLPGSRVQEIRKILPAMLSVIPYFPDYQFIVAIKTEHLELVEQIIHKINKNLSNRIKIVCNMSRDILKMSNFALVKSGTATLEAAILDCPQVVCYKTSFISYAIARLVALVRFISLPNLIMNEQIVPELIQYQLNTKNITNELQKIISDKGNSQKENYQVLRGKLKSNLNANAEIARHIVNH
jgi:lipid-A-disaccharide synthase